MIHRSACLLRSQDAQNLQDSTVSESRKRAKKVHHTCRFPKKAIDANREPENVTAAYFIQLSWPSLLETRRRMSESVQLTKPYSCVMHGLVMKPAENAVVVSRMT